MKKIKKQLSYLIIFSLLTVVVTGCVATKSPEVKNDNKQNNIPKQVSLNVQELKSDMVSFDRAYIPALSFTSQEKIRESKQSMELLLENWNNFKKKYYLQNAGDSDWSRDLDKIDVLIVNADNVVKSEKNILDAHQKYLEEVRIIFMNLRARNNIDYYIDYLTKFHEPMEKIVLSAKGKNVDTFTDKDLAVIKNTFAEAMEKFNNLENADIEAEVFNFNAQKIAQIKKIIQDEGNSLKALSLALESNDRENIIK